jgi:subtilisin family serine protease
MVRQRKDKPRFAGWIEKLEDRRVMSADPPLDALPPVDLTTTLTPPPVDQHVLDQPDFWIDTSLQTGLDGYFQQVDQMLNEAHNLTGWWNVQQNYGFTGRGQTVAVIDTGVAWNHFALGGGFGAGYRVVGGWDFTEENDGVPYDDTGSHGTHVSGIIGSSASGATGVSPGVDLVGLRVFNDAGQGFFHWIESALQWIHNNRNSFANPITAVNLSLGVSTYNSATIPLWANLEEEFAQLEADGIFIAVSAGNSFGDFGTPGLSYPAASPYVVPVMSTNDAGSISSFSQRLGRAIAAPGESIVSTVPDHNGNGNGIADDFGAKSGTSMAAPYVAGASTLIRQAMQFVGMTGITQDAIYNHMMATADNVFDAATGQTYKRLNLARAIDSLMPADDYGSTAGAAFNLGTFNGTVSRNGKIGSKSDVDCFTFTAGTTGKVTFSANCTMGMAPSWQLWGATALSSAAGTLSFNIMAGQTYTLGLSTTTCVGNYSLSSTFDSSQPFTFTDWGPASFNQTNDLSVSGEKWYRVQATRTGTLTATGTFDPAGGNVNFALYNSNLQLIAGGTTAAGQARADVAATNGNFYYLKVTGANADVDFKIANLVTHSGNAVTVGGTSADDAFILATGGSHWLSVNGVSYGFGLGAVNQITFDGAGGTDAVTYYGSASAETVALRLGQMTVSGSGWNATINNFESQTAYSGGGADVANLYDSAGNDSLTALPNQVTLTFANGQASQVHGFARAKAWATAGGVDAAAFYDGAANDLFIAGQLRGILTGYGYWNEAEGFDQTIAYAQNGGVDRVEYYDSAGNDVLTAWSDRVTFAGAGFAHDARGFEQTMTYGTSGVDQATFYDSTGDDVWTAWSNRALLTGAGYSNEVRGFDAVKAWSTAGGVDAATFYDTSGNDLFIAGSLRAILTGAGYWNEAEGFDQTTAHATAGGYDRVDYYDSAGDDALVAWSNRVTFTGAGFAHDARGFESAKAWSTVGGVDAATFYDTSGNDLFIAGSLRAILTGAGYWNEAEGFDQTIAHATAGGYDRADYYDSAGDDLFTAWSQRATFTGTGFAHESRGFDKTKAWSTTGGNDQATFYDSVGNDAFIAGSLRAILTGASYWNEAEGFDGTTANATAGGNDRVDLYGSSNVDDLVGAGSSATFSGLAFLHEMVGFDAMTGHGFAANDDVNLQSTDYIFTQVGV